MKFVKERVNVICQELARLSISQKIKITDMQVKNGCYITPAEADASEEPWTSFDTVNDRWYGPDKHYWFRTTITVPESFDGKNLWMRVHAGLDDWDDGRNPQFLLFANGEVIQGMDINHREVLVRENAKAGEKIQLDLQSYTGTLHSEFRLLADLEEHDAKIEEIYYDLIVPMQGLNRMDEDNKTRLDLETASSTLAFSRDLRRILRISLINCSPMARTIMAITSLKPNRNNLSGNSSKNFSITPGERSMSVISDISAILVSISHTLPESYYLFCFLCCLFCLFPFN